MDIARGTFRLSIVIAVLVAVYYGISDFMTAVNSNAENMRIWTTLRCGERFLGQDMSSYTSPVRSDVIDIGKAGCSSSTFWATRDEIREAVAQTDPPVSPYTYSRVGLWALLPAAYAFVAVNLAGFLFLGARGLFRWVRAGYR
jgi:hypothetical protein